MKCCDSHVSRDFCRDTKNALFACIRYFLVDIVYEYISFFILTKGSGTAVRTGFIDFLEFFKTILKQ